ncbi:MAG: lytic transglycosylase domain-containing protein [Novosphingobium sp.]|nr:lytic transglycosylase domain-containing protein [Novosphingobium sp.]
MGATAPTPQVHAAIARASQATGIDFSYLLGQARLESSLNPDARAGTSSAAGLYQFTRGTWLATLDRHGSEHGLGWADAAIQGGRVRDPALRQQVLALRYDPDASALMAAELASDNRNYLASVLGREPDPAELYMAHFLGADGAGRFLTALATDPGQSAAALFPKAAGANRAIFYDASGAPRSLGGVMELLRGKMARAMGSAGPDDWLPSPGERGWGWGNHVGVEPPSQPFPTGEGLSQPTSRPSMADTLAATFGAGREAMPAHVRQAYGKLRVFGL